MSETTLSFERGDLQFTKIQLDQPGKYTLTIDGYLSRSSISSDCEIINVNPAPINGLRKQETFVVNDSQTIINSSLEQFDDNIPCVELSSIEAKNEVDIRVLKVPSMSKIPDNFMHDCINLETLFLPDDGSLEEIGENAFENCRSLTSIVIPSSCKKIGRGAFNNCTRAQIIVCPIDIDDMSFQNRPDDIICNVVKNDENTKAQKMLAASSGMLRTSLEDLFDVPTPDISAIQIGKNHYDLSRLNNDQITPNLISACLSNSLSSDDYVKNLHKKIESIQLKNPELSAQRFMCENFKLDYKSVYWIRCAIQGQIDELGSILKNLFTGTFKGMTGNLKDAAEIFGTFGENKAKKQFDDAYAKLSAIESTQETLMDNVVNCLKHAAVGDVVSFTTPVYYNSPWYSMQETPAFFEQCPFLKTINNFIYGSAKPRDFSYDMAEVNSAISSMTQIKLSGDTMGYQTGWLNYQKSNVISGLVNALAKSYNMTDLKLEKVFKTSFDFIKNGCIDAGEIITKTYNDLYLLNPITYVTALEDIACGALSAILNLCLGFCTFIASLFSFIISIFGSDDHDSMFTKIALATKSITDKTASLVKLFQDGFNEMIIIYGEYKKKFLALIPIPEKVCSEIHGTGDVVVKLLVTQHHDKSCDGDFLKDDDNDPYYHTYEATDCDSNDIYASNINNYLSSVSLEHIANSRKQAAQAALDSKNMANKLIQSISAEGAYTEKKYNQLTTALSVGKIDYQNKTKELMLSSDQRNSYSTKLNEYSNKLNNMSKEIIKKYIEFKRAPEDVQNEYNIAKADVDAAAEQFNKINAGIGELQSKLKTLSADIDLSTEQEKYYYEILNSNLLSDEAINMISNIMQQNNKKYKEELDKYNDAVEQLSTWQSKIDKKFSDCCKTVEVRFTIGHDTLAYFNPQDASTLAGLVDTYNLNHAPREAMRSALVTVVNNAYRKQRNELTFNHSLSAIGDGVDMLIGNVNPTTYTACFYYDKECGNDMCECNTNSGAFANEISAYGFNQLSILDPCVSSVLSVYGFE